MNNNDNNRKRDIFYGVIAVATLIIALIGATLAYFSLSVRSNEGAINAVSAIVSVEYKDGQAVIAQATELIPATLAVVKEAYEHNLQAINEQAAEPYSDDPDDPDERYNLCLDSKGQEICSVFRFSVVNNITGTGLPAKAILQSERNEFTYLAYAVRNVTTGSWLTLDDTTNSQSKGIPKCDNAASNPLDRCYDIDEYDQKVYTTIAKNSVFGYDSNSEFNEISITSVKQEYDLVVFIMENGENQNIDQGKQFSGTLIVDIEDSSATQITGDNSDWN